MDGAAGVFFGAEAASVGAKTLCVLRSRDDEDDAPKFAIEGESFLFSGEAVFDASGLDVGFGLENIFCYLNILYSVNSTP